jgi:hypothetical protein
VRCEKDICVRSRFVEKIAHLGQVAVGIPNTIGSIVSSDFREQQVRARGGTGTGGATCCGYRNGAAGQHVPLAEERE